MEGGRDYLYVLYRTWEDRELRQMRAAFEQDASQGADDEFCRRRIAVIDRILAERQARKEE